MAKKSTVAKEPQPAAEDLAKADAFIDRMSGADVGVVIDAMTNNSGSAIEVQRGLIQNWLSYTLNFQRPPGFSRSIVEIADIVVPAIKQADFIGSKDHPDILKANFQLHCERLKERFRVPLAYIFSIINEEKAPVVKEKTRSKKATAKLEINASIRQEKRPG